MNKSLPAITWFGLVLAGSPGLGEEPKPPPAIRVRLVRPDEQARRAIRLFEGTKAPHPAAALAAWKRASAEPNRLGRPMEAMIAAFNPRMAEELKTLDGAEVSIWFDPESGQPCWSAILPKDDGTFAALATALVLSGGAAEGPMVDRLGPPGSPLMAKDPRGTLLSKSREGLKRASERFDVPSPKSPIQGVHVSIEPDSLRGSKSPTIRRLAEVIRPSSNDLDRGALLPTELNLSPAGDTFLAIMSQEGESQIKLAPLEPAWLDWIPSDRTMVGFALGTDPAAKAWDSLFGLIDRVEKLDSTREGMAPVRIRLDLLARVVGVRAEADVLLHLKGVSGWVGSDGKVIDAALVALHLDEQAAAERLVARVKPVPGSGPVPLTEAGRPRSLGTLDGRPLRISRIERSVVVTWGEGAFEASRRARTNPDRSAGPKLRESWEPEMRTTFAGGIWAGRVPGLWPEGSPLARALADSPPIVLQHGKPTHLISILNLKWTRLDATVKRFLDLIPLDPPPDH